MPAIESGDEPPGSAASATTKSKMVHVTDMGPPLGAGIPKSPSFHQGLAFAADGAAEDEVDGGCYAALHFGKYYGGSSAAAAAIQYQPGLQPRLHGKFPARALILSYVHTFHANI